MTERKKNKRFPKRARIGMSNASYKHGGYVLDLLTEEEHKQYMSTSAFTIGPQICFHSEKAIWERFDKK